MYYIVPDKVLLVLQRTKHKKYYNASERNAPFKGHFFWEAAGCSRQDRFVLCGDLLMMIWLSMRLAVVVW